MICPVVHLLLPLRTMQNAGPREGEIHVFNQEKDIGNYCSCGIAPDFRHDKNEYCRRSNSERHTSNGKDFHYSPRPRTQESRRRTNG